MPSVFERLRVTLAPGIRVERELGAGGMGIVFLGYDTVLARSIAIKALRPELATAVAAERFRREAQGAASLHHANVVPVHYTGVADGIQYYTMDYVPGKTLETTLAEEGAFPLERVVRLGRDLLGALAAAHSHDLIHRDVKPSNIFFDGERWLLGDFGVAYAVDSTRSGITVSGVPVGTLAYMPPEQLGSGPVTFASDLYNVGLVLYEAATGRRWEPQAEPNRRRLAPLPGPLRRAIRRTLQREPAARWSDAGEFSAALQAAGRHPPRAGLAVGIAAVLLAGGAAYWWASDRRIDEPQDVVIFPFSTAGLPDSSSGPRLAGLTGWSFERLPGLHTVPRHVAFRAWRNSNLPTGQRLDDLTIRLRSRYGVWAVVRPRGARLEVELHVVDRRGAPLYQASVWGDSTDLVVLGDSIAFSIIHRAFPRLEPAFRKVALGPAPQSPALIEFLAGEEAFARDGWLTAERHYLRALELDSTFVLAAWRLGNARRWMPLRREPPFPPGFLSLFEARRDEVPEVDRLLIEAQFRPSGEPRFERYRQAMRLIRDDPYAALLYGDELFHRGALAGRPLMDAVGILDSAVAADSTLAPAWEHLAWALIRLGRRDRAAAALERLERVAGRPEESEIFLPPLLRLAYQLRFAPGTVSAGGALAGMPGALALAARGAITFGLLTEQVELGRALAHGRDPGPVRASGYIGAGIALVALGRQLEALGAFDSAVPLFESPAEARLQAAEWRVIPAALGAPGFPAEEAARGRTGLAAMADDPVVGRRSAWALALDAEARGDTAAALQWGTRLGDSAGDDGLARLLDGFARARRGELDSALAVTAPALAHDSAGLPDPFFRAALHLARGEWLARSGRISEADRAWLWYENLDVRGWPTAEAQAAEVDWALAPWARTRRDALRSGRM